MTSPAMPVLPTIWMTSAGTTFSSAALLICQPPLLFLGRFQAGNRSDDLLHDVLRFACVDNGRSRRADIDSKRHAQLLLARDKYERRVPFLAEDRQVCDHLWRLYVLGNHHKL